MERTSTGVEQPIRVLIVDDHRLFAQALASVLDHEDDITVVGLAASLSAGIGILGAEPVDVVLLDYRLPDASGLEGVSTIRDTAPHAAVVMVTASEDERLLLAAVEAGCAGFVTKTTSDLDAIQLAVRRAAAGEASIAPQLLTRLLGQLARRGTGLGADLTVRENEVLQSIGAGLTNAEIAERLVLSVNTVRNHVQSVLVKLDAHSKLEAATIAVREGLIDPVRRAGPKPRTHGTTGR